MDRDSMGFTNLMLPQVMASRYRLDSWLGAGGMAEVFVATDLVLGRRVAVKRMPSTAIADGTARARFAREGRALARVNHPNVVAVFDAIEDDGQPFLVMELVDGTTLRDALEQEAGLSPMRAFEIASGITSGLAAVHAEGIVHRDLKPSNVFITASGAIKIGDFGIARIASDPALTRTGEMFGSAPYVAPEQVRGDPVDARADLYALGCVMFEMFAGRPPFEGDDAMSLTYHHVHTEPTRIETLVPGIPSAVASIVHGLVAKDPEDRPRSADDLGRALAAVSDADLGTPLDADLSAGPDIAPTVPLPRTPTALLPPPPVVERVHGPFASWVPWVALVALGAAALIVLNAVTGGTLGAAPERQRSSPGASTSQTSPSRSASPTPSPTSAPVAPADSPSDAALVLVTLVQGLQSADALGGDLAKDLEQGVDEVRKDLDHGDTESAFDEIGRMQDTLASALDNVEVSPEDGQRLQDAIDQLASTIDQLASSENGSHQDEGDEGD